MMSHKAVIILEKGQSPCCERATPSNGREGARPVLRAEVLGSDTKT